MSDGKECSSNGTNVIKTEGNRFYRYCSSKSSYTTFVSDDLKEKDSIKCEPYPCAEKVNLSLNLGLGLGIDPMNPTLRATCKVMSDVFSIVEGLLLSLWLMIPVIIRHKLIMIMWAIFFFVHKRIIGRKSGIHEDASEEYHAFTSAQWWNRLFPMTIDRMRFGLNQMESVVPPTGKAFSTKDVNCEKTGAKGIYVQINEVPAERTIFWLYGGAYLSGDCIGNLGVAEMVARATNCDVFLAEYRLLPEHEYADCIEDGHKAYEYLIKEKGKDPKNVYMFGISSGSGVATYVMQDLAIRKPSMLPRGAALMCPFVDYTEPKGSMVHYVKHDLIVTEAVYAKGIPYLKIKLGCHENRVKASPVYRSFKGLPPMLVIASEHECCYDMIVTMVNNARAQGARVDFAVWKYLCHVFPMLYAFVPEGKEAIDVMIDWIKKN